MWVVHSLSPQTDLKPGDLRRRLIEHAQDPQALVRLLEQKEKRAESELERLVMRRLVSAGYRVTPQWMVGSYRIDMVVEGGGKRLAVECDGDRYHPLEKLQEDMERQAILERLGWTFVRIRGSEFFREPDRAMTPVFARLAALEIPPDSSQSEAGSEEKGRHELLERLIRRAEQLRRDWASADPLGAAGQHLAYAIRSDPVSGVLDADGIRRQQENRNNRKDEGREWRPPNLPSQGTIGRTIVELQKAQDRSILEGQGGLSMPKYELTFKKEKETRNTIRYQEEENPGKPKIIGVLYVQKWLAPPDAIKVTVEWSSK